jgi:transposase InsO family protein
VIYFLETNIFSRFGLPLEIITDNGPAFISAKLTQFLAKLGVKHFTSSTYYPQGNGQAESTNKNMVRIIKRLIEEHRYSNRGRTPSVTTHTTRSKINTPMF